MFGKTPSLSTPFLRLKASSTLSSSKNSLGPKSVEFLALQIVKAKLLWEQPTIQTSYHLPEFPLKGRTLLESLPTSTSISLHSIFYFVKTLLITGTSFSFLSLTITFVIIL